MRRAEVNDSESEGRIRYISSFYFQSKIDQWFNNERL